MRSPFPKAAGCSPSHKVSRVSPRRHHTDRLTLAARTTQWSQTGVKKKIMSQRAEHPCFASGIIERSDNRILISLPQTPAQTPAQSQAQDDDEIQRLWQFPRTAVRNRETPEDAMRRLALERLDISVEIVVGQPPLLCEINGRQVEIRYFFCGVAGGEVSQASFQELRWVLPAHLREYEFDPPSQEVVLWLLASDSPDRK